MTVSISAGRTDCRTALSGAVGVTPCQDAGIQDKGIQDTASQDAATDPAALSVREALAASTSIRACRVPARVDSGKVVPMVVRPSLAGLVAPVPPRAEMLRPAGSDPVAAGHRVADLAETRAAGAVDLRQTRGATIPD